MNPTPEQLRASALKVSSPKPIRLEVDGLGITFVQVQTAYTHDVAHKKMLAAKKKLDEAKEDDHCGTGRLLACTLCDADGNFIYDVNNPDDVAMLAKWPVGIVNTVLEAANAANKNDPKT